MQQVSLKSANFPIKIWPSTQVYVSEIVVISPTKQFCHIINELYIYPHLHMHNILIYYLWYGITTVNFALSPVQIKTLQPQRVCCIIVWIFSMNVCFLDRFGRFYTISRTCTIFCTTDTLYSAHYDVGMSAPKQFFLFPMSSKYITRSIIKLYPTFTNPYLHIYVYIL